MEWLKISWRSSFKQEETNVAGTKHKKMCVSELWLVSFYFWLVEKMAQVFETNH